MRRSRWLFIGFQLREIHDIFDIFSLESTMSRYNPSQSHDDAHEMRRTFSSSVMARFEPKNYLR